MPSVNRRTSSERNDAERKTPNAGAQEPPRGRQGDPRRPRLGSVKPVDCFEEAAIALAGSRHDPRRARRVPGPARDPVLSYRASKSRRGWLGSSQHKAKRCNSGF